MIVENNFLKKIKDFGLNTYEAKIWTALLSRGVASAGELSDISNVPRSRSYDVLESLEKKGFIVMKIGKPIKYIAVKPAEVIDRVKKKVNEDAHNTLALMEELKDSDVLKELSQLHNNGIESIAPEDITGSMRGQQNIYDHLNLMIKEAEQDIVIMTTEEGLSRKEDGLYRQLKKASERGVNVRIAAPLTSKNASSQELFRTIATLKHIEHINGRFLIADGKQLTFMLTHDQETHPSYDIGVWVNTELFAQALTMLFDTVWNNTPSQTIKAKNKA
jgi:HTH-type transcriptional regulator, sugar sensing transcriptional regulator